MIERERRYLLRSLPEGIKNCRSKEIIDIYFPKDHPHPAIRVRKDGSKFEFTKKEPHPDDHTKLFEQNVILSEHEFTALSVIDGKKVHKVRYYMPHGNHTLEINIFKGALAGLAMLEVEFKDDTQTESFTMPDFCLAEVTGEEWAAGGMLCGRSYEDIKPHLDRFGYRRIV